MKKKRMKIIKLLVLPIVLILSSCNTEEMYLKDKGTSNKNGIVSKYLTGQEAKKVADVLKNELRDNSDSNLSSTKANSTHMRLGQLQIDYNNILLVLDTLGVKNYTFKIINHPEDSEAIFHNLVLNEDQYNIRKLLMLKYENENQELPFYQFQGTISKKGISDETNPCDNGTYDANFNTGLIVPGNGGAVGTLPPSGGSIPFSGNPPNNSGSGGDDSGSVPHLTLHFICNSNNCSFSASSWSVFSTHRDGNGNVWAFTIIVGRSSSAPTTLTDPCGNGGSIGVVEPVREYFSPENIELIENYLENNPLGLVDIPCDQIVKWQALAQYNLPLSTISKISNLQDQNLSAVPTWDIQFLAGAQGSTVNMDFFPVTISEFPNNPSTNQPYTPQEFYNFYRLNLNTFVAGTDVSFSPSTITGQIETSIWNSSNPLDAVISINMQPDSGSVVCSEYTNNYWYFTTLTTPWAFSFSQDDYDGAHPVSGNREFGYYLNTSGNYVFYVRGVDRIQRSSVSTIASWMNPENPYEKPDELWNQMKQNMVNFVTNNGGTAINNANEIYRPDWNKVKEVLRGKRPISDLGCD